MVPRRIERFWGNLPDGVATVWKVRSRFTAFFISTTGNHRFFWFYCDNAKSTYWTKSSAWAGTGSFVGNQFRWRNGCAEIGRAYCGTGRYGGFKGFCFEFIWCYRYGTGRFGWQIAGYPPDGNHGITRFPRLERGRGYLDLWAWICFGSWRNRISHLGSPDDSSWYWFDCCGRAW